MCPFQMSRTDELDRPEQEFLRRGVRAGLDGESVDWSVASQASQNSDLSELDWECLLASAEWHGVIPLLAAAVHDSDAGSVPDEITERVAEESNDIGRRNIYLVSELTTVLDRLDDHGVEALPFKGPALAAQVYGDVSWRPFADLDLLVPKRQADDVLEELLEAGYEPEQELTASERDQFRRTEYHHTLSSPDGVYQVEVHWRVAPERFPYPFDYDAMRERGVSVEIKGRSIPTLAPEDHLLVCCLHGCRHRWEKLKWLVDVAAFAEHEAIAVDWPTVFAEARRLGIERMVALALALARNLLDADLPSDAAVALAAAPAVESLRREVDPFAHGASSVDRLLFEARARDRRRDRCRHYLRAALEPAPADFRAVSLPATLFPLYYLVRPIRLAGVFARRLV